jgi:predicted phosphodiesterase
MFLGGINWWFSRFKVLPAEVVIAVVSVVAKRRAGLPVNIGLIGDVHAEDLLLEEAIEALTGLGADLLVCTGDIAHGCGSLDRCCELLAEHRVSAVAGNHDRTLLEKSGKGSLSPGKQPPGQWALDYLRALPPVRMIPTVEGMLMLCHGLGDDDLFRLAAGPPSQQTAERLDSFTAAAGVRWVVNGHSHQHQMLTWQGVSFVNAGTLARAYQPVYGLLDVVRASARFFALRPQTQAGPEPSASGTPG